MTNLLALDWLLSYVREFVTIKKNKKEESIIWLEIPRRLRKEKKIPNLLCRDPKVNALIGRRNFGEFLKRNHAILNQDS